MAIGDAPKPKKPKITELEAFSQLQFESFVLAHQKSFTALEKIDPNLAIKVKPDYEEFMRIAVEVAKKHPRGYASASFSTSLMNDVKKITPKNWWLKLVYDAMARRAPIPLHEIDKTTLEKMKQDVEKRVKGEDIN